MRTILLVAWVLFLTGCTSARRLEVRPDGTRIEHRYVSIGTAKTVKRIKYGELEILGLNSDESKGLESVATGIVKGAKGLP